MQYFFVRSCLSVLNIKVLSSPCPAYSLSVLHTPCQSAYSLPVCILLVSLHTPCHSCLLLVSLHIPCQSAYSLSVCILLVSLHTPCQSAHSLSVLHTPCQSYILSVSDLTSYIVLVPFPFSLSVLSHKLPSTSRNIDHFSNSHSH